LHDGRRSARYGARYPPRAMSPRDADGSLDAGASRAARPEDFLELLERARQGRLKVYLGYAAGVGKTYRMLQEAHGLKQRGVDVVLAYIEPHDRADTLALVAGLEVVPRRKITFRGVTVEELDLEAVLARRPTIAVVDELPHTNAPGSKHGKRWEDVLELLEAGIHVLAAMNVQHVESLNDMVKQTAGVAVRETVPDSFLRRADQVVNVDVAVDELLERLKAGKVYPGAERTARALEAFFRVENLDALREITLREVAEDIHRRREDRRRAAGAGDAGKVASEDRVVVAMASASPRAKALLRRGSRLAGRLNATWFVVYVATPDEDPLRVDAEVQRRLHDNLELARTLGAEVVKLTGTDVPATILEFARARAAQHLVIGALLRVTLRDRLFGSVTERLIRAARGVGIYVMTFDEQDA
jgi:two-component system sensor histidine kinase KdpD